MAKAKKRSKAKTKMKPKLVKNNLKSLKNSNTGKDAETNGYASKKVIAIVIVAILFILAFFVVKSFITALFAGIILAYLLYVPYKKLNKLIKKPEVSSAIICVITIVILGLALYFIAQITIKEAFQFYVSIQKLDIFNILNTALVKIFPESPDLTRQITITLQQSLTNLLNSFVSKVGKILTDAPTILIQFFVAFFIMFYFLKDGDKIINHVKEILPFSPEINKRFIKMSREITFATIFGYVVIGTLQGIIGGIFFYVLHAPSPLFFTLIAVFFGILPLVGPWLVFIPVGLVMAASGNYMNGILLMIFGTMVSGLIGTIGTSVVVGRKARINPAIVLIGMLGGMALMGIVGLIIGPLLLEYLVVFTEIYRTGTRQVKSKLNKNVTES